MPEDFSIIVENNCGASENLTSSQFPSLGNSAMLASYYVEPALEADKTSPNVISNMSDITLAVSNLNLDKSNLSAESSESTAIESSLSTVAGTERKSVQSNSDKDPKIVDSKENITEDTQELSRFFKEEKFGTDKLGKAFFDALAQTIPVSTSSGLSGDGSVFDYFNPLNTHAVFSEDTKSYDYWIATPSTKQQLATLASSPIGTYFPEKEHLTMPGVIITEDLVCRKVVLPNLAVVDLKKEGVRKWCE